MTFSGRQLRGRQLTTFKKSNTNSWRFFDAKQIKGVLKFSPSEVNNLLVQEAEKRFDQNFNVKQEERTKRKCKATTIHINEEVSGKVEGISRDTVETEAYDVIKSDTTFPLLAGGTQISSDSNPFDSRTLMQPPLDLSLSNISTSDTAIKSSNLATTDSLIRDNDSNIFNSDHRDISDSNLRPQHINTSHSIPEHTRSLFLTNINGMNGLQESNATKENDLRLIEYPMHKSKDIIENIMIDKTVTSVARSLWTSVVNIVRKNTDVLRLFSSHKKRNSTQSSCVSVNPEFVNPGTFVTSLAYMNFLTDIITDHAIDLDNSKSDHINEKLALPNINNNNTITSAINSNKNNHTNNNNTNTNTMDKSVPIAPQPPSLSKPSIKSLRQRSMTPHNPNPNQIQINLKNIIPSTNDTHSSPTPPLGVKKRPNRNDLRTKATTRQPKITTKDKNDEDKRKLIKLEDYQNLNIAKEFKMHLINNGHRIPHFLENVVISNIAPLKKKINKNENKNNDSDKNDDDDDNVVNSEIAATLNNDENHDNNIDDNNEKISDDENDIVNSKAIAPLNNDEINDNDDDDNNDEKDEVDDNDINISKAAALLDDNESNDKNNDDNNGRDDKNDKIITAMSNITPGAMNVLKNSA